MGCALVGALGSGVKHGPGSRLCGASSWCQARSTLPQGASLARGKEVSSGPSEWVGALGRAVGSECPLGSGNRVEGPPAFRSPSGLRLGAALPGSQEGRSVQTMASRSPDRT